jgi:Uncharacterised nucleotidyltransferase
MKKQRTFDATPRPLSFLCKALSPLTTEGEIRVLRKAAADRDVRWEEVARYANRANLAPALCCALKSKGLWDDAPSRLREYLETMYRFNRGRNEELLEELHHAARLLNEAGIVPLPLKGAAALATDLYPDPGMRFMWDLDLLVPEEKIGAAVSALRHGGYAVSGDVRRFLSPEVWFHRKHYPPLVRTGSPASIELHRRLLSRDAILEPGSLWRDAEPAACGGLPGVSLKLLSPIHQAIHCFAHSELEHQYHALFRIDLRQLLHFSYLHERFGHEIDGEKLLSFVTERRAARALTDYLYLAHKLFGVRAPSSRAFDPKAERHYNRALFLQKRKRLGTLNAMGRQIFSIFSKRSLLARYPLSEGVSIHRLRLRHFVYLLGKYRRPGPWKDMIGQQIKPFENND